MRPGLPPGKTNIGYTIWQHFSKPNGWMDVRGRAGRATGDARAGVDAHEAVRWRVVNKASEGVGGASDERERDAARQAGRGEAAAEAEEEEELSMSLAELHERAGKLAGAVRRTEEEALALVGAASFQALRDMLWAHTSDGDGALTSRLPIDPALV